MSLLHTHFLEFIAVLNSYFWFMDILLTDFSELQISSIKPLIQIQTLHQRYKHQNDCYLFISYPTAQLTWSMLHFSICHHFAYWFCIWSCDLFTFLRLFYHQYEKWKNNAEHAICNQGVKIIELIFWNKVDLIKGTGKGVSLFSVTHVEVWTDNS
jgi:hypothetical protein